MKTPFFLLSLLNLGTTWKNNVLPTRMVWFLKERGDSLPTAFVIFVACGTSDFTKYGARVQECLSQGKVGSSRVQGSGAFSVCYAIRQRTLSYDMQFLPASDA